VVIPALKRAGEIAGAIRSASESGVEIAVVDGEVLGATTEDTHSTGARGLSCPPGRVRRLQRGADVTAMKRHGRVAALALCASPSARGYLVDWICQ
jgi:hypothetical protein